MIDDKNLDSINFYTYTKKELLHKKNIEEIQFILEKYNILENQNTLISSTENFFLYIINFIFNNYQNKSDIPKDLRNIFMNNFYFQEQINLYLNKKLELLINDSSNRFNDDLNVLIYISCIFSDEKIFDDNYNYNFDSISKIFRSYEERLKNLFSNSDKLFSTTFDTYLVLLKIFIQLCTINSIDLVKKRDINIIIDLLTETINIIKFSIILNEHQLSEVNNILGKFLYYFSHIEDVIFTKKDIKNNFEKFILLIERQEDGFLISKNNYFGHENNGDNIDEFLIFKNNSAILLLKFIKELKKQKNYETYFDDEYFQKIIKIYHQRFSLKEQIEQIKNIDDLQNRLISSFLLNYNSNLDFSKKIDYHFVLEDFLLNGTKFEYKNLKVIYKIVLFADDIEDFKYFQIIDILSNSEKIENNFYEYYKLSIFNLFIDKSLDSSIHTENFSLFDNIINYIQRTKFQSNLISIYLKTYLNIALFYSQNNIDMKKAKNALALFFELNKNEDTQNYYSSIIHNILNNLNLPKEKFDKTTFINNHLIKNIESKNLIENYIYDEDDLIY